MKSSSRMHLSKFLKCVQLFVWPILHQIMLMSLSVVTYHAYLQRITVCHSVISHFKILLLNYCTDLLQILWGCFLGKSLLKLWKSRCYPNFSQHICLRYFTICHHLILHFWHTLLNPMYGFASHFVWMILLYTPIKIDKMGCHLYLSWNNW